MKRRAAADVDEKPPLQLINPMAIRRSLPKVLKVKTEKAAPKTKAPTASNAQQDEAHEWRRKLFEAEHGLLIEKIVTEKKNSAH